MNGLIRVTPDKEKANSILKMVNKTLEMVKEIDIGRFPSNVTKEYYEVIRELISIVLLLDGYKVAGEGAHKKLIEYLESNYKQFGAYRISLIDELRIIRNRIAYDGFFVKKDYLERKLGDIKIIINELNQIIKDRL
ncbi:MAG: hypothetical protein ISS25_04505 [Nanoarchaeota archaeon]|nr:hypothetical protein [DPANN group archaeon]MBL7117063.1 hypothetical protein [Nanoarchaeota archaeon]